MMQKTITKRDLVGYLSTLNPNEPVNLKDIALEFNSDVTHRSDLEIDTQMIGILDLIEITNMLQYTMCLDEAWNFEHQNETIRFNSMNNNMIGPYVYHTKVQKLPYFEYQFIKTTSEKYFKKVTNGEYLNTLINCFLDAKDSQLGMI